jgi:alkylhydroperoxidase/carboxymuconolactone decarboxylase family protein YurZ
MAPLKAPDKDRYERGLAILQEVAATEDPQVLADLARVAPDLGRYLVEFAYGDVYARPGLSLRRRELAAVAALAALGNATPQLRFHAQGARNAGAMEPEINEARSGQTTGALTAQDREIVAVARLTALGTPRHQELLLRINALLDAGGSPADVVETILLMVVFAGFPAALNGMAAAREVFAARSYGGPPPSRR